MGLLDDAIREHLELKRRHGAPDDEVERLEKEAFGPLSSPGAAPPAAEPAADLPEPEAESEPAAVAAPQPEPEPSPRPSLVDEEPWLDEPDEVPADEGLDRARPAAQPTTEFTAADRAAAQGEPEYVAPDEEPSDDVLEETPDFLQETPEHDRLWFEQKPPRDFDFDG